MIETFSLKENETSLDYYNYYNGKDPAKVGFFTLNEEMIFESQFPFKTTMEEVVKFFLSKMPFDILLQYFSNINEINKDKFIYQIKYNDKYEDLEVTKKDISYYLTKIQDTALMIMLAEKHSKTTSYRIPVSNRYLKIYVKFEKNYFSLSKDFDQYIIDNTYLIGKPMINDLRFYIYNKIMTEIKLLKCSKDEFKKLKINFFSRMSVYCNARNNLYLYEGSDISSKQNNGKFFEINLQKFKTKIISSKFPNRILHSMIYIPECYIFIIGGKGAKDVLVYNINRDEEKFEKYPYLLPRELYEPSLITVNNKYLYAFENSTFRFYIYRINLLNVSPFEEIKIRNANINQKFFGVVKMKDRHSILFLGGQFISLNKGPNPKEKCFEFDYEKNELCLSQRYFQSFDFIEKTFIPMQKDSYMQIEEFKHENSYSPKVILFHENYESLKNSSKILKNNPRYRESAFKSFNSNDLKINVPENVISLVGTDSSYDDMPIVPLYNNK